LGPSLQFLSLYAYSCFELSDLYLPYSMDVSVSALNLCTQEQMSLLPGSFPKRTLLFLFFLWKTPPSNPHFPFLAQDQLLVPVTFPLAGPPQLFWSVSPDPDWHSFLDEPFLAMPASSFPWITSLATTLSFHTCFVYRLLGLFPEVIPFL